MSSSLTKILVSGIGALMIYPLESNLKKFEFLPGLFPQLIINTGPSQSALFSTAGCIYGSMTAYDLYSFCQGSLKTVKMQNEDSKEFKIYEVPIIKYFTGISMITSIVVNYSSYTHSNDIFINTIPLIAIGLETVCDALNYNPIWSSGTAIDGSDHIIIASTILL